MKTLKKYLLTILAFFPYTLLVPLVTLAQATGAGGLGSGGGCGGGGGLINPLQFCSISEFLFALVDIILVFAVPVIVFFIVYAGFMYVTAQGDTSKLQKARTALTWAIVGGVIVLGAKILAEVIKATVDQFKT